MKCENCSADLLEGSAFCAECGAAVAANRDGVTFMPGATIIDTRTTAQTLEPGSTFHDRYEIEEMIGAGGMGAVYRAKDMQTGTTIALKVINTARIGGTAAADRLVAEGLLTRNIRHPNVIAVYDVAKDGDDPYLSMELCEGVSLRKWLGTQLTAGGEVSLDAARKITLAILDGLEAAHGANVVHRDLSPENVMLLGEPESEDFQLKILDFGIARAAEGGMAVSASGGLGKPLYMAPEQRTTPDAAGPAADIYSLSRMLYELLMEVLPEGPWQAPSKHRSDVPEGIDSLLERSLSNRPKSRPQSVDEFRAEFLSALGRSEPITEEKTPEPERGGVTPPPVVDDRKKSAKGPPAWIFIVGGGVLLLGIIAAIFTDDGSSVNSGYSGGTTYESGGSTVTGGEYDGLAGFWIDEIGGRWTISVNGSQIYGTGYILGEPVTLTGAFTGAQFSGRLTDGYGETAGVRGGMRNDGIHFDAQIQTPTGYQPFLWHINHFAE